jgi:hypothetical protein
MMEEQTSIQSRFERFDQAHPEIYGEFRAIAYDLLRRGRRHYGSKAILEVIRYHRILSGQDEHELFKINNNYSSRYARKLIDEDNRFEQFFELRELRSA